MMRRGRSVFVSLVGLIACVALFATVGAASSASSSATWSGTWKRAANQIDAGGPTIFRIHQSGIRLTGSFPWQGCSSKKGGTFVGFALGRNAVIAARQTDGSLLNLHMQLTADGRHMSGRWNVTAGTCAGSAGPFDAARVSR